MSTALPPLPAADETARPAASSFSRAPLCLPTSHAQTIVPALFARRPDVAYRRERWDTPDGDFIDVDWLAPPAGAAGGADRPGPRAGPPTPKVGERRDRARRAAPAFGANQTSANKTGGGIAWRRATRMPSIHAMDAVVGPQRT